MHFVKIFGACGGLSRCKLQIKHTIFERRLRRAKKQRREGAAKTLLTILAREPSTQIKNLSNFGVRYGTLWLLFHGVFSGPDGTRSHLDWDPRYSFCENNTVELRETLSFCENSTAPNSSPALVGAKIW